MHEVYRRVMRGELYYALRSLDMLRWSIAAGWDMEKNRMPNQMGDWSKYEGKRSLLEEQQKSQLEKWDCHRNSDYIMLVLHSIIPEFKRLHKTLCEQLNITYRNEWMDQIIEFVV